VTLFQRQGVSLAVFSRRWILAVAVVLAAGCDSVRSETAQPAAAAEPLAIVTHDGRTLAFRVEVVDTDASRERGLMFRKSLAPNAGMLFDFVDPRPVAFWMRNTLIPLDMIFISQDGHIANIARQAKPMDETPIPSDGAVRGVLEIKGGRAAALGIEPGDMVRHRIFG